MPTIVDGKTIAARIIAKVTRRTRKLKRHGIVPELAVVLVGDERSSHLYVRRKGEIAENAGIRFLRFDYPAASAQKKIITELEKIQSEHRLSGLIVQLPLPRKLTTETSAILNHIHETIDVDALTDTSLGKILRGTNELLPPTPAAIMEILSHYRVALSGKHVVVLGRGNLIGKPLANIFMNLPVTLTLCGSATPRFARFTRQADILICGVGKPKLVQGSMIKPGAVVIDAGISFTGGKLNGDVDFVSTARQAALLTPVPGGVGPITVAKLLENTVRNAEKLFLRGRMVS